MRVIIIAAFACVFCCASARGQAEGSWAQTVDRLAHGIMDSNAATVDSCLIEHAAIRSFNSSRNETPASLLLGGTGQVLLGAHSYTYPPESMAGDVSDDVKSAAGISDAVKAHLIPHGDAELHQANETAQQWLAEELAAHDNDLVAVVVLWPGGDKSATEPIFVLLKGRETGPQQFKVTQAVYGVAGRGREISHKKAQKAQKMRDIKQVCDVIRETVFALHGYLRGGHLEKVYENGLVHRLSQKGLRVKPQHLLKVYDEDGTVLGDYCADLFVEDCLIIEIKACKALIDEHVAQLLGYLRASNIEHGLLVNFGVAKFEIRKYILSRHNVTEAPP